jgi:5'-3' exonuclease
MEENKSISLFKINVCNSKSKYNGQSIGDMYESVPLSKINIYDVPIKVIIDASNYIYRYCTAMKKPITDKDGNITSHIYGAIKNIKNLMNANVALTFIFDSAEANIYKAKENMTRKNKKDRINKSEHLDQETKERRTFSLTSKIINDFKEMLDYLGIPYIQLTGNTVDAESYAAYLTRGEPGCRQYDYCFSGDSDVLLFKGNIVRAVSGKKKDGTDSKVIKYQIIEYARLLQDIDLTEEQFTNLGIIIGNDFISKQDRIGVKTAMKYVLDPKFELNEDQVAIYKYITSDDIKTTPHTIHLSELNLDKLAKFLLDKGFNADKVEGYVMSFGG